MISNHTTELFFELFNKLKASDDVYYDDQLMIMQIIMTMIMMITMMMSLVQAEFWLSMMRALRYAGEKGMEGGGLSLLKGCCCCCCWHCKYAC